MCPPSGVDIMGCNKSKSLFECCSDSPSNNINPVFTISNELRVKGKSYNESSNVDLAEKIVQSRSFVKENKNIKYDKKIINKYEIKALVGRGKFTKVFRVEHKFTREPYALKLLIDNKGVESMETEVNVLQRVNHENVISLVEVFLTGDKISALVLSLNIGGDIFDRLFDYGVFTETNAVEVLWQVLSAVKYLHSLGITHRDLKPNNILFYHPTKDSIVVTDFTLAHMKKSAEDVFMTTSCGTPQYLAPELVLQRPYTETVDLWAVGLVAFIMLTGDYPFPLDDNNAMLRAIARADFSLQGEKWESKSTECREFITSLLVVHNRPSAEDTLQHSWITSRHGHGRGSHHAQCNRHRTGSSGSCSSSSSTLSRLREVSSASHYRRRNEHNNNTSTLFYPSTHPSVANLSTYRRKNTTNQHTLRSKKKKTRSKQTTPRMSW